ncbi:MAG: twin-arginine translocation pathway signal protein [Acidobacteria bacterium]|nr:MAG: twin-arginine translocation pathway signal protein [Acidobacteriota bacterium]
MNRRRILAGTVSVVFLGLVALFLPSLHKTAEPAAPTMQPVAQPPTETAATRAESEPPSIPAPVVEAKVAALPPAPQSAALPDVDPHKTFGSRNAPVTMETFSDYQCPACKTLFMTTNRRLMDDYVSTGKVYLIHRDFPLAMHAHSRVAARYARAAAQIGKVEAVEQSLFQNQEKWEQSGDVDGTVAAVLSPAEMAKVRALVKGGTLDSLIDKDFALGQTYRVNQTPTTIFHCKGQTFPYSGVMTYDTLKTFLDQLLSQK